MIRAVDSPDPSAYLGTEIGGRYVIDELLGKGGFAFVFKGRAPEGRRIAIKILYSTDAVARARFFREIKVLKGLPANPYVVEHVDDGLTADGRPFLVLEFIEGQTVMQMMSRYNKLEPRMAARFVASLCEAFVGLHELGVAHRDVKPENILVAFDGRIKLIDFGLIRDAQGILAFLEQDDPLESRIFSEELDQRILVGTPEYMAPEQFQDAIDTDVATSRTDTWSDVFSLGVILFEMIAGQNPFPIKRRTGKHLPRVEIFKYMRWRLGLTDDDVPSCGVTPALDSILRKALRRDPRQRQRDAHALKADLDRFLKTGVGVRTSYDSYTLNVSFSELEARREASAAAPKPRDSQDDLTDPQLSAEPQLEAPDTLLEEPSWMQGPRVFKWEHTTSIDAVPADDSLDEETTAARGVTPRIVTAAEKTARPPAAPRPPQPAHHDDDLGKPIVIIDLPPPQGSKRPPAAGLQPIGKVAAKARVAQQKSASDAIEALRDTVRTTLPDDIDDEGPAR
jgi:serine/threonine protein kinase